MPRLSAAPISLTPAQEEELQRLARAHKTPRKLAERAEMILRSAAGTPVREIARELGVWPKTVRHWRAQWLASSAQTPVVARLTDAPRPGAPATFSPEQVCAIMGKRPAMAAVFVLGRGAGGGLPSPCQGSNSSIEWKGRSVVRASTSAGTACGSLSLISVAFAGDVYADARHPPWVGLRKWDVADGRELRARQRSRRWATSSSARGAVRRSVGWGGQQCGRARRPDRPRD